MKLSLKNLILIAAVLLILLFTVPEKNLTEVPFALDAKAWLERESPPLFDKGEAWVKNALTGLVGTAFDSAEEKIQEEIHNELENKEQEIKDKIDDI